MKAAHRLAVIDAALMGVAIFGALICGLRFGPMLRAGDADATAFLLPILGAACFIGLFALWRRKGWPRIFLPGWTLAGGIFSALLLTAVASGQWPAFGARSVPDAPRLSLAVFSALDLVQGGQGAQPALSRRFAVERLDIVTAGSLADHRRMLLAQPRLMTPEELVAFDAWVRHGGHAVILADPLLLWRDDMPGGDRREPPITSLLDPLLAHWGLTLAPAEDSAVGRRFVGRHLLRVAGASRFVTGPVAQARCDAEADGLIVICAVGRGQVRLIADADFIDARLWRGEDDSAMVSDAIALIDHWLRFPQAPVPDEGASAWVRDEASLRSGLRAALAFGTIWAMLGGFLLWHRKQLGKAGT